MKKNVWIMNHYATNMFEDKGGRHHWLAKYLSLNGYNPTIFCANTFHNSTKIIETNGLFKIDKSENLSYVFVKTSPAKGNGIARIKNMVLFYLNLKRTATQLVKQGNIPDVILASSVHPLTLLAGIQLGKKFDVPVICEVRDLWPESLIAYGSLKTNSPLTKVLYMGEKWIYKKADKIIFTMEGGKDYIADKGWDKDTKQPIDTSKVFHVNNGVDLESFNYNKKNNTVTDTDLTNQETFKVVYTGSVRKVNNVGKIIEVAEIFQDKGIKDVEFLIYGSGPEKEKLENYCETNKLTTVKFKGKVDKNQVPFILSHSNLNIIHFQQNDNEKYENDIKKYGASLNKMFEYFASGKPTISDCEFGYDLIKRYNAGMVLDKADVNKFAEGILEFQMMSNETYKLYSENAIKAAKDYDFKNLTLKLIDIIEN